jgi:hypothetical protein
VITVENPIELDPHEKAKVMLDVKTLAEKILGFLHEEEEKRGRNDISIPALYKTFEKDAPFDVVQQSIRYLADRDLIAPFSYSLTAKGRREHSLKPKN